MGLMEDEAYQNMVDFHEEWGEWCLEYIRYLQEDIGFMQGLLEINQDKDWDLDLALRNLIWEEERLISNLKKEVVNARKAAKSVERGNPEAVPGGGQDSKLPRTGLDSSGPKEQLHQPEVKDTVSG